MIFLCTLPTRLGRLLYLRTLSLSLMHYRRLHFNVCTPEIVCLRLFIAQLILNYICSYFYTCDDLWQIVISDGRAEKCFLFEFIFLYRITFCSRFVVSHLKLMGFFASLLLPFLNFRWYFRKIKRIEAEKKLLLPENEHGAFLIRDSESRHNDYSLSGKFQIRIIIIT